MLGHGWPKKNFHEPPLLDNIVRKCYISTCCAHEAAFFPVNVHLLGAHSGLGLAVCTSLGLLIGAYVFVCLLDLGNMYWYFMWDRGQPLLLCTLVWLSVHVSVHNAHDVLYICTICTIVSA